MAVDCTFTGLREERETLTLRLRALAAELDGIDRELADRAWRPAPDWADPMDDLEARHSRLTAHLRSLAARLHHLDERLWAS